MPVSSHKTNLITKGLIAFCSSMTRGKKKEPADTEGRYGGIILEIII